MNAKHDQQPPKKKLTINVEKLKRLTPEALNELGGGYPPLSGPLCLPETWTCSCPDYTC